ncbi:hypothetical protein PS723_05341 [Pseudomonas fluorescens]|uniref:Uncharacterized protein n=1 Tax=Pseudomonas fluorescens TaxID=294 RepID=A0A5E7F8H9_PSEFL|nr:hypothetical protein PS723_05341 [Pseudomonas fluorescens]
MAEQFIQRVPLLRLVKPLAFFADDQLRDRLRVGWEAEGRLQLFSGHLAVAVVTLETLESNFAEPHVQYSTVRSSFFLQER